MLIRIINDNCTQKLLNDLIGPYAGESSPKHVKGTALTALPKSVAPATF